MFTLTNLDSFRLRRIDIEIENNWVAFNPSIALNGDGFAATVRVANFRICPHGPLYRGGGGQYQIGVHESLDNKLYFITLDKNLKIYTNKEIDTHSVRQNRKFRYGFEDARLFQWQNKWWAITNIPGRFFINSCNMALLELEDIIQTSHITVWQSPFNRTREKNWAPVINGADLFIIYEWHPLIVFKVIPPGFNLEQTAKVDIPALTDWHGSSQGIPTDNGWLFVIHTRVPNPSHTRHIHRFIELNRNFEPVRMSEPFVFLHDGIEFCAGMAEKGDRLYISFGGFHDDHAFVSSVERREIESMLKKY
jgi:hypothetical protein